MHFEATSQPRAPSSQAFSRASPVKAHEPRLKDAPTVISFINVTVEIRSVIKVKATRIKKTLAALGSLCLVWKF
jgi:hypothetical protein